MATKPRTEEEYAHRRAIAAAWRAKNRERIREQSRIRNLRRKEKMRASVKEWQDRTPGARRAHRQLYKARRSGCCACVSRLTEDNARLTSTLAMTVGRLGGEVEGHETARHNFLQRIDALRLMEEEVHHAHAAMARDADVISYLRAHVAALVKAGRDIVEDCTKRGVCDVTLLSGLLDAPDLAALVARAQQRDAVIAAAREVRENFPDRGLYQDWEQALIEALAALDTKEP
jgi:hypothetical protein